MKLKFLDLNKQSRNIENQILKSLKQNIKTSSFIGGQDLLLFQNEFKKYLKIKYCLGVANGTDALEIAIKTLKLKDKSEIIVPSNSWISTAEAVLNNNLKVKFVDVDDTHNICINDLKNKISKKTSAIIVVHLFGNPANLSEILKLKKKYNLKLIEDCAQAHGAEYNGKKISNFSDIATFSFFPSKNLGCYGDGGCIVTNFKKYYLEMKKIANHGGLKKNSHLILGRNSRLDNIQAGILRIKLKQLDKWIEIRKKQAKIYFKNLSKIKKISFVRQLKNTKPSYHLMVIKSPFRNKLKNYLKKKGVNTGIHYPYALPEVPIFKKNHYNYCKNMKSIELRKNILSLPIGEHLNSKQIIYVCKVINNFFDA